MTDRSSTNYTNIKTNVRSDDHVDADGFEVQFVGCDCQPGSCTASPSCSCIQLSGGQRHYDDASRLVALLDDSKPIFECSGNCLCYEDEHVSSCHNRVVQLGDSSKVEVFNIDTTGIGCGVRAMARLECGEFVAEYLGEVISRDVARQRIVQSKVEQHNYLFTVCEFFSGEFHRTYIDARNFGGVARFINHSCTPNLQPQVVRVGVPSPRLALFAARTIEPGEELAYDYGCYTSAESDLAKDSSNHNKRSRSSKPCLCGAVTCRGVLPSFSDDNL